MIDPCSYVGATVRDIDNDTIGDIGQVYLNDETSAPEWVTVKTGLFGHKETFVPLAGATGTPEGGLTVPYTKDTVKDAPRVDADGALSTTEAEDLYRYYRLDTAAGAGEVARSGADDGDADATLTRSEERLKVGKEKVETGTARLRKYVVTENQQVTVPVTHEEVRLERTPIEDGTPGGRIEEAEASVTLHAEKPVVAKETVAVEQVRLGSEQVTEDRTVSESVRKEQIEADTDPNGKPRK